MKYFNALTLDLGLGLLAYMWLHGGVDGAGNAFLGLNWALSVMGLLVGLAHISGGLPDSSGCAWQAYSYARAFAKAVCFAWLGLFWLMGLHVVASLSVAAARVQHRKLVELAGKAKWESRT